MLVRVTPGEAVSEGDVGITDVPNHLVVENGLAVCPTGYPT